MENENDHIEFFGPLRHHYDVWAINLILEAQIKRCLDSSKYPKLRRFISDNNVERTNREDKQRLNRACLQLIYAASNEAPEAEIERILFHYDLRLTIREVILIIRAIHVFYPGAWMSLGNWNNLKWVA